MTHAVGGRRRRLPRGWLLPLGLIVAFLIATSGGLFSRSILLDFLAWWPVWGLLAWFAFKGRDARWGRVRVAGLVPLVVTLTLGMFGWAYAAGWVVMPSAGLLLVGPESTTADVAALSSRIDGPLEVNSSETGFLYEVQPLRSGGDIAGPSAVERTQGTAFSVALSPIADPGLYTFSGWDLALSTGVTWSLTLAGKPLRAQFEAMTLAQLNLLGQGEVSLGTPAASSTVTVDGTFVIEVPQEAGVRVIGEAKVPTGWTTTSDGWVSPSGGEDGWVVSVSPGASLEVVER